MINGYEIWSGPSKLDGSPIVVIATGIVRSSANAKTGGMVQTYILRADVSPTAAVKSGADVSICGGCPHRGNGDGTGRTCYVNVGQGPLVVWKAWKRGAYPLAGHHDGCLEFPGTEEIGAGRVVRIGSYGDPAAVPVWVWESLTRRAVGRTGYTHQWRKCDPALMRFVMASCDSEQDATEARARGFRYFRVAFPRDVARLHGEAICPASAEAGHKIQCDQCLACDGTAGKRGSVVIRAHGGRAVMANVQKFA